MPIPLCQRHRRYKLQQAKLEKWLINTTRHLHGYEDIEHSSNPISNMAELVRTARPKIHVPQEIHNLVASIIYDRTIAAETYRKFQQGRRPDANQRHEVFIEDLKSVQASLWGLRLARPKKRSKQAATALTRFELEGTESLPSSTPQPYKGLCVVPYDVESNRPRKVLCNVLVREDSNAISDFWSMASSGPEPQSGRTPASYAEVLRKPYR